VSDINPQTPFDTDLLRRRRERAAAHWDKFNFLKARVAVELAERLLDANRTFETGLDVGAHSGELRSPLLATGKLASLFHADSSAAMLAAGTSPAVVMNEEHLAVGDAQVDFVCSALALHRLNDLPGALIQIRRALKPDGLFLGALFGGETLHELRSALAEAEAEIEGGVSPRIFPFADVRDVGGLMQRAGFALPVVDADRQLVTYENVFGLIRDLRGMGETNALNARRRKPLRRATLMRLAEIYAERFSTPDGRITATFQIIYAAGWSPHESQQQPLRRGSATQRLADALNADEIETGDKPQ
jgi:SAM-dependent methyltransferase